VASCPVGTTKEEKFIGLKNKKKRRMCFISAGTRSQDIYKRNAGGVLSMLAREIKIFTKETQEAFHQY